MAETTRVLRIILEGADQGAKKAISGVGGALGSLGTVAGGPALGGVALVTRAIAGIGAASFSMATQVEQSQTSLQAALGTTQERAQELGQVALGVFGNNFASSVDKATQGVITARQQLGDLSDTELQRATENAFRLADTFGVDLSKSLSAVRTLTDEFGLSQQQAFDFLTTGFQQGLDASGDFIDSVGEYSNLFADSGATAGQFFSLMETGLAGGALGTDKAADAFKEFQIKFLEGGDEVEAALDEMGIEHNDFINQIRTGEKSTIDAFEQVVSAIAAIEDPVQRNLVGVQLMGTQFEDMGGSAVAALSLTTTAMEDTAGATEALDAKYNTLGSAMEGLKRQAQVALAPIGGILLDGVNAAMPGIQAAVGWFTTTAAPIIQQFAQQAGAWIAQFIQQARPIVQQFAEQWRGTVGPALMLVRDAIDRISVAFGGNTNRISGMNTALTLLKAVLDAVIFGIQAGAIAFQGVAWAVEQVSQAIQTAIGLWNQMGDVVETVGDKIPDWLIPGSPPPLFHAINDINKAINQMPDLSEAFGFNNAPAGAPVNGSMLNTAVPPGASTKNEFTITIRANSEEEGRQAGIGLVDALRQRGLPVGV